MEKLFKICILASFFVLSTAINYCSLCNIICGKENTISTSTTTIPTTKASTTASTNKQEKYEYRITSDPGSFDNTREQCQKQEGDLFSSFLSPEKQKYGKQVKKLIESHPEDLWLGLTDRGTEGTWRSVNDGKWNEQINLEDDNSKNCFSFNYTSLEFEAKDCSTHLRGLCEIKITN